MRNKSRYRHKCINYYLLVVNPAKAAAVYGTSFMVCMFGY